MAVKDNNFQILSARDQSRLRTGMYLGSVSNDVISRFVKGEWVEVTYVPAVFKMINEIIDNSIDEAIRTGFKFATKIDITIDGDRVTITDNGRGIPQHEVTDVNSGKKLLQPTAAWTLVNSGTSFEAERVTSGANGVGSAVTNYHSTEFLGETWRDKNKITVACKNGAETVDVTQIKCAAGSGTKVSFVPDFSLFECDRLDSGDLISLVEDRLYSLQLAFPEIAFTFNGKKLPITDFKSYAGLFARGGASVISDKTDNVSYFFTSSNDGFRTNSFVNGVNTYTGGTYVDYVVNSVVDELVVMIKKKHKVEVSKSTIKGGLSFVMFARNFTNPKFDSQTKEKLSNSLGQVREHFAASGTKDLTSIAKKVFAADDIILPLIEAQIAKKNADERRDAIKAQKGLKKVRVAKHIAATTEDSRLFLVEGDSALSFCLSVRDPKKHGFFPLRGVIMNTWDLKPSEVLKNKELSELIAILGLDINDPESYRYMKYREVATLTDADHDGNRIATMLMSFFYKFWPKLFDDQRMLITRTPVMVSEKGKEFKWCYSYEDAEKWKQDNPSWHHRMIKGLGLLREEEYSTIINNPSMYRVTVDDASMFEMMFGKDAKPRKEFMMK